MGNEFADLDQKLFGWVYRAVRGLVAPTKKRGPGAVPLESLTMRLGVLAEGVAERPTRIEASDGYGGVSGAVIRLPACIDVFPDAVDNALVYVDRTVLAAMARRYGLHRPEDADELVARLAALALVPALRTVVREELPAFDALHARVGAMWLARPTEPPSSPRDRAVAVLVRAVLADQGSGDVDLDRELAALATLRPDRALAPALTIARRIAALPHGRAASQELAGPLVGTLLPAPIAAPVSADAKEADAGALPSGSERKARAPDALRRVELPEEREGENPLEHSFEKIHTAEEYRGGRKAMDGEDQLEEHSDALDELHVKEVIRTREAARSVYRMDGGESFEAADLLHEEPLDGAVFHYDEWDGSHYRSRHCRLVVQVPVVRPGLRVPRRDAASMARERNVRRVFEALEQARRFRPRMPSGSEVDVDAMVERHGFVRAGTEGPTRLYLDRPRLEPDVATLVLLDLSSSSDAYIEQRHVIDVARDAVTVLASVLDQLAAPFAIGGFHSHTRQDCRYLSFKTFDEPWSVARPRLYAVEPTGYTRMGPALRHATSLLEKGPGRRKALLLVTDGRPTDYDRYEGRYGVTDVKKACDEAASRGIAVFALAMAEARKPHLNAMFGPGGYEVLAHPDQLADRLSRAEAFFRR